MDNHCLFQTPGHPADSYADALNTEWGEAVKTWWFVTVSNCWETWHWQSAGSYLTSGSGVGVSVHTAGLPLPVNYITIWLLHLPLGLVRHCSVSSWLALCRGVLPIPQPKMLVVKLWSYCEKASPSVAMSRSLSVIIQHTAKRVQCNITASLALWLPASPWEQAVISRLTKAIKYKCECGQSSSALILCLT